MDYKLISKSSKPKENEKDKQLFSYDVCSVGAKNFLFSTYENIYKIIKSSKINNFYEDNTFSTGIKLFVDYDDKIIFNSNLERDKYAEKIVETVTSEINKKLYDLLIYTFFSIFLLEVKK